MARIAGCRRRAKGVGIMRLPFCTNSGSAKKVRSRASAALIAGWLRLRCSPRARYVAQIEQRIEADQEIEIETLEAHGSP
jgi:hypothetical protein